jgi:hypothetical protein
MEMLERCPGCSVTREVEPVKSSGAKRARPCAHCGYNGPFPAAQAAPVVPHRDSMPSFAGARAKLATATQDLFRLSGNYSIPVEAPPAPEPVHNPPPPDSGGRKAEASMMFSLEALMKANSSSAAPKRDDAGDRANDQLWSMQGATPLFGTANDQALLTTPLRMEPAPSMDSMTLPSHAPNGRRWPLLLALGAGLALAGGGIWMFGTPNGAGVSTVSAAPAPVEAAPPTLPSPEPSPQPAPGSAVSAAAAPGEKPEEALPAAPPSGEATLAGSEAAPAVATDVTPGVGAPAGASAQGALAPKADASKAAVKKPLPRATAPSGQKPAPFDKVTAFDKNAAKAALNNAASLAGQCGQGGAPGKGKVQLTFTPNGKVSDAQLVEGAFAGTAAGKCALRHFRAAKVPPFSGAAITVAKSFKVE